MRTLIVKILFIAFLLPQAVQAVDSVGVPASEASSVQLILWSPFVDGPSYVIPKLGGETESQAVMEYILSLKKQPDLLPFVKDFTDETNFRAQMVEPEDAVLFLANKIEDQSRQAARAMNFMGQVPVEKKYLLAIAAGERLSSSDRKTFHTLIAEKFPVLVVMGGDDVAPEFYSEAPNGARNFNSKRDKHEIELIKIYSARQKGFIFGICRGHQLVSIAMGYKLFQDIDLEIKSKVAHNHANHTVTLQETTRGTLKNALMSHSAFNSASPFEVYSYHHQAVKFQPGGPLEVAAISADGVIEALEFLNGLGLLLQFHPELYLSEQSNKLMSFVAYQVQKRSRTASCEYVF